MSYNRGYQKGTNYYHNQSRYQNAKVQSSTSNNNYPQSTQNNKPKQEEDQTDLSLPQKDSQNIKEIQEKNIEKKDQLTMSQHIKREEGDEIIGLKKKKKKNKKKKNEEGNMNMNINMGNNSNNSDDEGKEKEKEKEKSIIIQKEKEEIPHSKDKDNVEINNNSITSESITISKVNNDEEIINNNNNNNNNNINNNNIDEDDLDQSSNSNDKVTCPINDIDNKDNNKPTEEFEDIQDYKPSNFLKKPTLNDQLSICNNVQIYVSNSKSYNNQDSQTNFNVVDKNAYLQLKENNCILEQKIEKLNKEKEKFEKYIYLNMNNDKNINGNNECIDDLIDLANMEILERDNKIEELEKKVKDLDLTNIKDFSLNKLSHLKEYYIKQLEIIDNTINDYSK